MKAIMPVLLPDVAALRKRTGADQWDEMWDGVLHMPPMPNREHQDFEWALETYLRHFWARPNGARVYHQINLSGSSDWIKNYRIPDLLLLTPERFDIDKNEYFEGAPDVVVEIHSPGDEAYEKLDFYADLGVPEVWIIDRDSREPEILLLKRSRYRAQKAGAGGWVRSPATDIEMKAGKKSKLSIRLAGDNSTRAELPED